MGLLAVCLWTLAALTRIGERVLVFPPIQDQEQAQPRPSGAGFRRRPFGSGYELTYLFRNFNQDVLTFVFTVVQAELDGSLSEFGWSKKEVDEIYARFGAQGEAQVQGKVRDYFASRGFRVLSGNTVQADIPLMVRRNAKRVNGLARVLARESEQREYGSEEIIGAATALVQTAVQYAIPPVIENGRHIAGMHTPPKALVDGWGDCDTKTALLGSLLANWDGIRAVGLSLPRHYLMGIQRVPRGGDVYVEYGGAHYVLIESAGPAWLAPGSVGIETQALLDSMEGIPIQPF